MDSPAGSLNCIACLMCKCQEKGLLLFVLLHACIDQSSFTQIITRQGLLLQETFAYNALITVP